MGSASLFLDTQRGAGKPFCCPGGTAGGQKPWVRRRSTRGGILPRFRFRRETRDNAAVDHPFGLLIMTLAVAPLQCLNPH